MHTSVWVSRPTKRVLRPDNQGCTNKTLHKILCKHGIHLGEIQMLLQYHPTDPTVSRNSSASMFQSKLFLIKLISTHGFTWNQASPASSSLICRMSEGPLTPLGTLAPRPLMLGGASATSAMWAHSAPGTAGQGLVPHYHSWDITSCVWRYCRKMVMNHLSKPLLK